MRQSIAGVEYGTECYCDNYLYNYPQFGQQMCYMMCSGNSSENVRSQEICCRVVLIITQCGGAGKIDIFVRPDFPAPPRPTAAGTSGTYASKGCYNDPGGNNKALTAYTTAVDTMTVDACAKFCLSKRQKWFGVEYG